mmetsp:Transcript_30060/g.82547  ORF Transcript_30060/g.82547 Transcript_30060/m.82547 type:complete len:235 (+) Transcript_30060:87-791(+)
MVSLGLPYRHLEVRAPKPSNASSSSSGGGVRAPTGRGGGDGSTTATCECWQWCCLSRKRPHPPLQRVVARLCSHPWQDKPSSRDTGICGSSTANASNGGCRNIGGSHRQTFGLSLRSAAVVPIFETRLPCGLFPSQVSELLDRDITPDDYEMLLQLDESISCSVVSKTDVDRLTAVCAKDYVGEKCTVCLLTFKSSDSVISLSCSHAFHRDCISKWLLERSRMCPLCGSEVAKS